MAKPKCLRRIFGKKDFENAFCEFVSNAKFPRKNNLNSSQLFEKVGKESFGFPEEVIFPPKDFPLFTI